jgi:hypothetical protein
MMGPTFDQRIQDKAEAHLRACYEAMEALEAVDLDPGSAGAISDPSYGPFCGCDTCLVREVLSVCWDEMWAEVSKLNAPPSQAPVTGDQGQGRGNEGTSPLGYP